MPDPRLTPLDDARPDTGAVTDAMLRGLLGYGMRRATHVVQADLAVTLKPFGLRMIPFSALIMISENSGLRQTQLADALGMERPNLVAILDDLEARGLIQRARAPQDRRAHALRITEAGQALTHRALMAVQAHEAAMFAPLDDAERTVLQRALRKVEHMGRERP